jgi:hypothetical protein
LEEGITVSEKLKEVLAERKESHGDFREQFAVAQTVKDALFDGSNGLTTPVQREALDQIAHKLSRIVTGNPNHADHWRDIAGYATLIADMLDTQTSVSQCGGQQIIPLSTPLLESILKPTQQVDKSYLHAGEVPTHYTTEEGGVWRKWRDNERVDYFAKKYTNGDIWDPIAGWR